MKMPRFCTTENDADDADNDADDANTMMQTTLKTMSGLQQIPRRFL